MSHPHTAGVISPGRKPHARYAQYDRFASIYNRQFGFFAQRVFPVISELMLQELPANASILDLCCGTGQLASALTARGFCVTGIDSSEEMLRYARWNAPQAVFLLEDARTFDHPSRYDGALSTFDSLNHIVGDGELEAVFANVFRALRAGGLFVFDMNVEEGFLARWWGRFQGTEGGTPYAIEAVYCHEEKRGRNVVTLFDETAGTKQQFSFVERSYSHSEIREALRVVGFPEVSILDGHRDLRLFGEIGRSFFVCRKPGELERSSAVQNSQISSGRPETQSSPMPAPEVTYRMRHRELDQCVADRLWPEDAVDPLLGGPGKRLRALEEVLCTLPPTVYRTLQQQSGRFQWYIPHSLILGQVHPFGATPGPARERSYSRVIFLSQLLEDHEWPVVVTVVVHELAHVILAHQLHDLDHDRYERQEQEARAALCHWGYRPECEAAEATLRELRESPRFDRPSSGPTDRDSVPFRRAAGRE